MKTIVLTGGGTAGHIMPNIALIDELKKHFDKIYYLGSPNGMEARLIKDINGVNFINISTTKLIRKFTLKNLAIPFKLIASIHSVKKILKQIKPDVIFSKGGFVSVPVVIAGARLKIPIISHESDLSLGLANKIILHYAKVMCVSFENTAKTNSKCVYTGSPVRNVIFSGNKQNVISKFNSYNPKLATVLFFGGSLGSANINNLVYNSLNILTKEYNIIHIVGKGNLKQIKTSGNGGYMQLEFTSQIQDFFDLADVVVSRGGANSLFELLALKKPTLIIPLSKKQSRGDQIENAKYFSNKKYAEVMLEEDMSSSLLIDKIHKLIKDKQTYQNAMQTAKAKDSNKIIVDLILKTKQGM